MNGTSICSESKDVTFNPDELVNVGPNPANNFAQVRVNSIAQYVIQWYDFAGKIVTCPVVSNSSNLLVFDTQSLVEGVYTVIANNGVHAGIDRIIVKH